MMRRMTGDRTLPMEIVQQVVAKTDGVPLFVEELTKTVLESGFLREADGAYELTAPLPPLAIPATLHASLMARLDRLSTVKIVAQLGAIIGRTFAYEVLQAIAPLDKATLQQGLRSGTALPAGVPPRPLTPFNALTQDGVSPLKSTRQQYHQRIAQVLAEQFPNCRDVPELLAHHHTNEAGHRASYPHWRGKETPATAQPNASRQPLHHWYRAAEDAARDARADPAHLDPVHCPRCADNQRQAAPEVVRPTPDRELKQ
jgi:predicted ATPase